MHSKRSLCYGIRLDGLAVIDCDDDNADLVTQMEARFGASPVHVQTPRGRHLYYRYDRQTLPNLRAEGLPVDIKRGANQYVMGQGSIRPDGGEYRPLKGDLAVDELPLIFTVAPTQSTGLAADYHSFYDVARPGLIREGERNTTLTREAIKMVGLVDDVDELTANLQAIRDDQFANPKTFPNTEVLKIARWAWERRCEGKLYHGRDSEFRVHREALDAIKRFDNASEAIALYVILLDQHGHKPAREFPFDHDGMQKAGHTNLSRRRFLAARETLASAGLIEVARQYSAGHRKRTYRLKRFRAEMPENVINMRQ